MAPSADPVMVKKLKGYDPCLQATWDRDRERWAIQRVDPQTRNTWHILFVHNADGTYRPLDERVLDQIYECDVWKHFDNAADFHRFIQDTNAKQRTSEQQLRRDYMQWWNKEHRTEWKSALDNMQRGILEIPTEHEKTIYSLPNHEEKS